jgi:hypothetical protein
MRNHIIFYNWKVNTGNPFRSSDLGVMSPARFLCAMPVEQNDVEGHPTLYNEKNL